MPKHNRKLPTQHILKHTGPSSLIFAKTMSCFGSYLNEIQDILDEKLVPSFFGVETAVSEEMRTVFNIPVSKGILSLTRIVKESESQFIDS